MYKSINRFLSALTAFVITSAAMTVFPVNAVEESEASSVTSSAKADLTYYDEEFKAPYKCADFMAWKDDNDNGEATIVHNSVGNYYVCSWDSTRLAEFLIGEGNVQNIDDVRDCFVKYEAALEGTESYAVGAAAEGLDLKNKKTAEIRVIDTYRSQLLTDLLVSSYVI